MTEPRPPFAAVLVGRMLRAAFAVLLLVRRPKPIHPKGVALEGVLRWRRPRARTGIRWIDEGGDPVPVVARLSRSVGLPAPLPDIVGLAIRAPGADGPIDLELSSTGAGVPSRFWLVPHRSPSRARLGTLLPYRTPAGPRLLCARTIAPADLPVALRDLGWALVDAPWHLRLYTAAPRGRWYAVADLELRAASGPRDLALRFDAADRPIPGTDSYPWVRAIREPSYHLVQGRPSQPDA